jgi:transposase-like protein
MPTAVLNGRAHDVGVADDPGARPRRRVFTAEYKLAILAEYDAAEADGSKGSILRREGLHSSHIVEWRRARDAGALEAMWSSPRIPETLSCVLIMLSVGEPGTPDRLERVSSNRSMNGDAADYTRSRSTRTVRCGAGPRTSKRIAPRAPA